MADNGKLQFFGQTVYPQTTVSNILNDDGTQWTPPPTPTTADNGKVLGVTNGAYALQEASGGGGGTQLYLHKIFTDEDSANETVLCVICAYSQPITSFLDFFDK